MTNKSPWTILHVDDDPDTLEVREMMFSDVEIFERPIHFLKAEHSEDAKAILDTTPIHLVLMDVVMGNELHSGLELVRYIREELNNTQTRIVILSGETFNVPVEKMLRAYQCDLILHKTEESASKQSKFIKRIQEQLNEYLNQESRKKEHGKVFDILHFDDDAGWLSNVSVMAKVEPRLNLKGSYETLDNCMALIEEHQPHAVLMDIYFSGSCDGIFAIREIRKNHPNLAIVVFTSRAHVAYFKLALDCYVKAFLSKNSIEGIRLLGQVCNAIESPHYLYDVALFDKFTKLSYFSQFASWKQLLAIVLEDEVNYETMAKLIQANNPGMIRHNVIRIGYEKLDKSDIEFDREFFR